MSSLINSLVILAFLCILIGMAITFFVSKLSSKRAAASKEKFAWITNKTILITGAASGIGRELAIKLAKFQPSYLILLDINDIQLQETRRMLDKTKLKATIIKCYKCNVSDHQNVNDVLKNITSSVQIDILVNNAGVVSGKSFLDLTHEDIQKTFGVNTLSHFWMLKVILPQMIKRGDGFIVSVSSMMGYLGSSRLVDYSSSKWAVNGLYESLRFELRKLNAHNVRTLLVCPYAVNTGMFHGIMEKHPWINRFLFPMLNTSDVVDRIIYGILRKEEIIVGCTSGWRRYLFPLTVHFAQMVPYGISDPILSMMGGLRGMDTFQGHRKTV